MTHLFYLYLDNKLDRTRQRSTKFMGLFDPNKAAEAGSGVFGLPFQEGDAALIYLPVPWEATTSYGGGTSKGPSAILEASKQVDLYDTEVLKPYEAGLYLLPESREIQKWNEKAKGLAQRIIESIESESDVESYSEQQEILDAVNLLSSKVNDYVYQESVRVLNENKILAVIGGDHSVPLGAIRAVAEKYSSFGILHFDAHSDTRVAYEGFVYSHASIMYNVLETIPRVKKLVQVGIRDICEQEVDYIKSQNERVSVYYDRELARRKFEAVSWASTCAEIIAQLPDQVWVSFDIDGLDPRFCPHTGTPVPGGLDFQEANYLLKTLAKSGKKIIGFDLNEVAPNLSDESDEWDANVGARLLYKLSGWTLVSQGKAKTL
jgi:agmatinase